MMGKMMSILFLVLVLLISLGLSQITYVSEGMETESPSVKDTSDMDMLGEEEVMEEDVSEVEPDMVTVNEKPKFDVVPMEGTSTEGMSNYR
jgi:hypothetical protein